MGPDGASLSNAADFCGIPPERAVVQIAPVFVAQGFDWTDVANVVLAAVGLLPLVEEARSHLTGSDPRVAQAPTPGRLPARRTP